MELIYNIEKKIKKEFEDRFYEDNIEELENEDFEDWEEIIDEILYEEGFRNEEFKCEVCERMEKVFDELKEEYLEGKKESWENEWELRNDYYRSLGV